MGYSIDEVRRSMPNVGDQRHGGTVDYVNKGKLWYRVMMPDGTHECHKLPKANTAHPRPPKPTFYPKQAGIAAKCRVVETNKVYNSFSKCAKDLGCAISTVQVAANAKTKLFEKYTIERLD